MPMICKILPLVLLAFALSLSSCVNEVKNPVKTQTQDTVAIDTNYLHGFTKVKIYFSGKGKYLGLISGMDTSLTSISYNSSAAQTTQWLNNQFSALYNYSYHTVTHDPNFGNDLTTSGATNIIFISTISDSGYRILSGVYKYSASQEQGYKFGPGPYGSSVQTSLVFLNLPLISKNADSMVYSFKGSQLQTQITQIQDSSTSTDSNIGTVVDNSVLKSILWDQQPSLTVTFSK